MKLNHSLIAVSLLILIAACSQQQEDKTQATSQQNAPVSSVENAKAVLDASKQIEQNTLNAAEQQRQLLEDTEQGR